jgi:2'-5' RNA ligase
MRMFVALRPSDEAVEDLDAFLEPRREASEGLRWTDPEQWHVTLAFMPAVSEEVAASLPDVLHEAAVNRSALTLSIAGGGAFPNPYSARVVWAGIAGANDALAKLARGVRRACNRAGASPEGGPFHPHITLARSRPMEATRWIRLFEGYVGPTWHATEMALVQSFLGQGRGRRPRHEVVATVPLDHA